MREEKIKFIFFNKTGILGVVDSKILDALLENLSPYEINSMKKDRNSFDSFIFIIAYLLNNREESTL